MAHDGAKHGIRALSADNRYAITSMGLAERSTCAMAPNNHPICASTSRFGRVEGALFSSSALSTVTSSLSAVRFNISACASSTNGELPRCLSVGNTVCRSQCMTIEAQNP